MMAFSNPGSAASTVPGQFLADPAAEAQQLPRLRPRKRKADTQDVNHERLNKRMSLLNLEQNVPKLYVPVEQSQLPPTTTATNNPQPSSLATSTTQTIDEEPMQLDDTKHKVYIYNLDDELSTSDSDSEPDTHPRLVLLPDLAAHLRANRLYIPRPLPPPSDAMQVVLYQPDGPPSLSVPAEHDGVRRAIVAARERVRERQALEQRGSGPRTGKVSFATPVRVARDVGEGGMVVDEDEVVAGRAGGSAAAAAAAGALDGEEDDGYDPDAMDID